MPQNTQSIFRLEHAGFYYAPDEPALIDINFEITRGERVCILGANGCGKSTLLKILAGLLFPQSGKFSAFDQIVTEKQFKNDSFSGKYHRRIGFIFQSADVQLFCSTVKEEIAFGLLQQELSAEEIHKRIQDVMQMLGIESLAEKAPFKLSGGEKKKVALAAVLAMNPDVLILDEPTNGLDPRTQIWLVRLLDALHDAGKTVISSTHNLELVTRISDRAILFSENHNIVSDRSTNETIRDLPLLKEVNFVDEFYTV